MLGVCADFAIIANFADLNAVFLYQQRFSKVSQANFRKIGFYLVTML